MKKHNMKKKTRVIVDICITLLCVMFTAFVAVYRKEPIILMFSLGAIVGTITDIYRHRSDE